MNLLTGFAQKFRRSLAHNRIRRQRTNAMRSALLRVVHCHPLYHDIGFDEHFMTYGAAKLMKPFLNGGPVPDSAALATVWATQFNFRPASAQKAIANVTPMINDFVYVLATEIQDISTPAPFEAERGPGSPIVQNRSLASGRATHPKGALMIN